MKRRCLGIVLVSLVSLGLLPVATAETALRQLSGTSPISQSGHVKHDIPYSADPEQRLDVYLPAHPKQAPVLLMVHGGAWIIGNKVNAADLANKLSQWGPKGYIIVSIDYRLLPKADPWVQANDVAKALAFVQSKALSWGGDPAKIILMGHSAGAHLVSLLASDPKLAQDNGVQAWLGTISLDSPVLNLEQIMNMQHPGLFDRVFGADPAFWQKLSPASQLKQAPNPMLLVCSSQRVFTCFQARQFAAKVNEMDGRATVLPVDLSHREINQNLGLPGVYTNSVNSFLHTLGLP